LRTVRIKQAIVSCVWDLNPVLVALDRLSTDVSADLERIQKEMDGLETQKAELTDQLARLKQVHSRVAYVLAALLTYMTSALAMICPTDSVVLQNCQLCIQDSDTIHTCCCAVFLQHFPLDKSAGRADVVFQIRGSNQLGGGVTTICAATLVFRGMSRAAHYAVWLNARPAASAQPRSVLLQATANAVMAAFKRQIIAMGMADMSDFGLAQLTSDQAPAA
jgi:hypothetical protein